MLQNTPNVFKHTNLRGMHRSDTRYNFPGDVLLKQFVVEVMSMEDQGTLQNHQFGAFRHPGKTKVLIPASNSRKQSYSTH